MISMAYMQLYHKYSHFNPHIYNLHVLNTPNYIHFLWSDSLMISNDIHATLSQVYIHISIPAFTTCTYYAHTQLLTILFF
jgi:hypothetical protein